MSKWRLIERGKGMHWPALEDIDVDDLLAGRRSKESRASLQHWLRTRTRADAKPTESLARSARRLAKLKRRA